MHAAVSVRHSLRDQVVHAVVEDVTHDDLEPVVCGLCQQLHESVYFQSSFFTKQSFLGASKTRDGERG